VRHRLTDPILYRRLALRPERIRDGRSRGISDGDEIGSEGGSPTMGKAREATRTGGRRQRPEIDAEEEEILQKAQIYLLFEAKRPMLWTVAGIRQEQSDDGSRRWIIAVHLRYPTGHEGYLRDLLYDGTRFTELT